MYVYAPVHAWCSRRPEKGMGFLGTRVTDTWVLRIEHTL